MSQKILAKQFHDSRRPHILMVTNHGIHDWDVRSGLRDTGGQNHYVNALSGALADLGFRVTTMNRGGFLDPLTKQQRKGSIYRSAHQRITYIEGGGNEFIRKEELNLHILSEEADFATSLLNKEALPIDLVISHYWDAAVLVNLLRERLRFQARHFWIPHSLGAMKQENFRGQPREVTDPLRFPDRIAFEKEALKGINAVVSTSGEISKFLREAYGREPELFLPPCIDTGLIHPLPPDAPLDRILNFLSKEDAVLRTKLISSRCVLEVSRTDRTKRKDIVIRAVASALKDHPDLICLLTISPDAKEVYDELCTVIDELGLREKIVFVGTVPREVMSELFALATIYITSADQESFGMSIQEAAACRRPIISSDRVPFATEYLLKAECRETITTSSGPVVLHVGAGALVCPAGDDEAFGIALSRLLADETLRGRLANGAYRATIPHFTWSNRTREFLKEAEIPIPSD